MGGTKRLLSVALTVTLMLAGVFVASAQTITLELWGDATHIKALEPVVEAFHSQQDQIRVNLVGKYPAPDTVIPPFLANTGPHIIYSGTAWDASYAKEGIIANIDSFMELYPEVKEDFLPGVLQEIEGSYYSLPLTLQMVGIYHNPVLFDQAGLSTPEVGWTRADLEDYASKLVRYNAAGQIEQWAVVTNSIWQLNQYLFAQLGTVLITEDYEVMPDTTKLRAVLDWAVDMVQQGKLNYRDVGWVGSNNDYGHRVGISFDGSFRQILWDAVKSPMSLVPPMQWDEETPPLVVVENRSLALMNNLTPQEQEAAYTFLRFVYQPENIVAFNTGIGFPPPTASAAYSDEFRIFSMEHNPNMLGWVNYYLPNIGTPEPAWPAELAASIYPIIEGLHRPVLRLEIPVGNSIEMLRSALTALVTEHLANK